MEDYRKLQEFFYKNKRMPTFEEMKRMFGVTSKNTVSYRIDKLIEAGLLDKIKGKLQLLEYGSVFKLGTVQAGFPSPAEEETCDLMSLDEFLIDHKQSTYMLEVKGESMIDAGIFEGDLVLVERGRTPKKGDIVLAMVEHEYTLKYLDMEKGVPVLIPANKKFKKIYPNPDSFRVEATLKAVIRKYR